MVGLTASKTLPIARNAITSAPRHAGSELGEGGAIRTSIDDILACPQLPSLPAAAIEVLELSKDPNLDLRQLADAIQKDPALTAKILRTVNSSYYRLSVPCPTITRALSYLGLNLVRSLVLGFSLVESTRSVAGDFDFEGFWRRTLTSATAARRIAAMHRRCDPDAAFTGALLSDIGMLAMHQVMRTNYSTVLDEAHEDHAVLPEHERQNFGFDHSTAGAALAEHWKLPLEIVGCIAMHHAGESVMGQLDDLPRTVAMATRFALSIEGGRPATMAALRRMGGTHFGLGASEVEDL
ncbi:MAG: HDOD domain-containing protein, partial [Planctomycetota bacterium]